MSETVMPEVHPGNEAIAAAWNGPDGDHWVRHAERFDRAVASHHAALLSAAGIRPGERVLDIGCGNGQTTRDAARLAAPGDVVGVDVSALLLASARRLADERNVTNVGFVNADAQVHPFPPAAFDVVISRTGVMFFADADAAFANIARAVRPGGRLALLVWREMDANEWFTALATTLVGQTLPAPPPGTPGPFSLGDPDRVRAILTGAGFRDVALEGRDEPMVFGDTAEEAFAFVSSFSFAQGVLRGLDDQARAHALARLRADVDAHLAADGVAYGSAAWVVTATRA